MSNFRLNLPIDIPWKLVNCSEDMMDKTFCNKKMPSPFRSSISLYTYDPKVEDIPEEYSKCGKQITYLKVSCSITGYQPTGEEQEQIIDLLTSVKNVDYSKIEDITNEYFGCYGVLLNVSVHPNQNHKDDLTKYPHIIDFEPKVRDFFQAASETGEILVGSTNKVTTSKSFGTTDSTQNSWNAGATMRIPEKKVEAAGVGSVSEGSPGELRGDTGQVRTETDQANWGVATDASRERREGQSTTTQLSQMYNLLTGLHAGTNRASFVMSPRPHIFESTNRRTFTQGLREIEGIQDFFLIVLRDKDQPILNVDAFLQTGHFSDNINIPTPTNESIYETSNYTIPLEGSINASDTQTIFGDGYKTEPFSRVLDVVDELNGWEADPTKGDPGRGGVEQINNVGTVTITEIDTETGDVIGTRQEQIVRESGVSNVEYSVEEGKLIVTCTLSAKRKNIFGTYGIAIFSRAYKIFLRRKKINPPTPIADVADLLITQRKLCTKITYNECISSVDLTNVKPTSIFDNVLGTIVGEKDFNVDDIIHRGSKVVGQSGIVNSDIRNGIVSDRPTMSDFGVKKALIRKIQNTMISALSAPSINENNPVSYTQTKHFQKRLLQILPKEILETSIHDLTFINPEVKDKVSKNVSLKEILSSNNLLASKQFGISKNEILNIKKPNTDVK